MEEKVFGIVTKHINDWDPEFLLVAGAPDDEYYPEIAKIVDFLFESEDFSNLAEEIQKIFEYYFDSKHEMEVCHSVAEDILKDIMKEMENWED